MIENLLISYIFENSQNSNLLNENYLNELIKGFDKIIDKDEKLKKELMKKRKTNNISKFYIKLLHLYYCIINIIKPRYIYKNNKSEVELNPSVCLVPLSSVNSQVPSIYSTTCIPDLDKYYNDSDFKDGIFHKRSKKAEKRYTQE